MFFIILYVFILNLYTLLSSFKASIQKAYSSQLIFYMSYIAGQIGLGVLL